jgi:protein-disulfide isomerase
MTSAAMKRKDAAPMNRNLIIIAVIVIIVVAVIAVLLIARGGGTSGDVDVASIQQSRAADGGFVLGNPDAPITIIEFADFACPHCQEYHPQITQFLKEYVATGKAKFEYRVFPTAGQMLSKQTGQYLECAEQQQPGAFWKGYNLMFGYAFSGRYTTEVGRLLASDLGLNYSEILSCASTATQVDTDIAFGTSSGVSGTPAVLVRYGDTPAQFVSYNGRTYNQGGVPYAVLAAISDQAQ